MEQIIFEVVCGVCLVQDVGVVLEEIEKVFKIFVVLIQNIFNVVCQQVLLVGYIFNIMNVIQEIILQIFVGIIVIVWSIGNLVKMVSEMCNLVFGFKLLEGVEQV